ncbi:hypothetical protein E4K72_11870 [Oxalobacteraceae bacterium OM1]|nr:hypothetical protein E4K72_11870 [Oxalobacteraceae bacterium OM1]
MTVATEQIAGTLVSYRLYNDKWGRGTLRLDEGDTIVVTGEALAGLTEGSRYRLDGRMVHHPKFGRQFECRVAAVDIPLDEDALVRHLCKNFKGCGIATARKMVDRYRDTLPALRDRLVNDPQSLDFTPVTRRRIAVLGESDRKALIYRHLSTRLAAALVRDSLLRKIADWLAQRVEHEPEAIEAAWALFSHNPYAPMRDIDGYGFVAADQIALAAIGFPRFHAYRLAALASHALRDACEQNGHVFLARDELEECIARIDPDVCAETAIAAAQAALERIVIERDRYYPSHLWHAERALALELAARALRMGEPIFAGSDAELVDGLATAERELSTPERPFRLDPSQHKAMARMLTSAHFIHTLTAGPGCGKTALMEILVQMARGKRVLFCAPTGKAAKVLAARLQRHGHTATTIHAMLGAGNEGFTYHAENPLEADIVVADESSMDDLVLTRALVSAVPPDAHLVFLGDVDQLPSIGPGQVLKDLLQLPFDHHRLTVTHRNDGGILEIVQQARVGEVDCQRRTDVLFSGRIPMPDDAGVSRVASAYLKSVERFGMERVGLLMPRRKGDPEVAGWNTTYLNDVLRQALNPEGRRVTGTSLRIGDRIIVRKNMALEQRADGTPGEQVVNGDTGFVRDAELDAGGTCVTSVQLELDDGRSIRFPGKELDAVGLGYALTVHAAQGSEYDVVIFVCTNGSPGFVHRGVIYTAFSRARRKLLVYGDDAVVRAVAGRAVPARNSGLVERTLKVMRRLQKAGGVGHAGPDVERAAA